MAFRLQHSSIPNDIIYHIICNGDIYIGQSIRGFNRLQSHCTNAFRYPNEDDGTGASVIYADMRKYGLMNTTIYYYTAPNYGLKDEDFAWFFSQFLPQGEEDWDPSKATESQRRDAAEILHILHMMLAGPYRVVNVSMGGQQGSYYYKLDKTMSKLLTRTMTPREALAVINASDESKKALLDMTNRVNEYLFTDSWKTVYNYTGGYIGFPSQDRNGNKLRYGSLTWNEFIDQVVMDFLPEQLEHQWFAHDKATIDDSKLYNAIRDFVFTKEAILLQYLTAAAADLNLTQAQRNVVHNQGAHLFTAELNLQPLVKYLGELIDNIASSLNKKKIYSKQLVAGRARQFHGVIRVSSVIDISSLHIRGYNTEYINNLGIGGGQAVSRDLLIGFSFSNFQYIYKRKVEKITYDQENIRYIELDTFGIDAVSIKKNPADNTVAAYPMTGKKVPKTLTNKIRDAFMDLNITWPLRDWPIYMRDMMSIYRVYNVPDATLDYHLESNGNVIWLTSDSDPLVRIYWGDVYYQDDSASSLQEIRIY